MRVRRCATLYLEPREDTAFDLTSLLAGGDGLARTRRWVALAPHLGEEVEVDAVERELLGELSPERWMSASELPAEARPALRRLLKAGLAIGSTRAHATHRERDERLRGAHWHPLAATLHAFTRWDDADAVQNMQDSGTETAVEMREVLGAPPPEADAVGDSDARIPLARVAGNDFDDLLARRATCRNFDPSRALPFDLFSQLMQRVFAAQAEVRVGEDTAFLKKSSPSGGGLHPTEAYLLVQHVEGLAPGLYHYHATAHALEPLPAPELPLREFLMQAVAQQHWFADAHVAVALAPRFDRTFWKYRRHMKGYRVVALEAGHLSQMLYLAATEAGLGAFITAAINEKPLEAAFGLDPLREGALAVCGFGWRGDTMETMELDPNGVVWEPATTRDDAD
ncbi:putative peptide maturation dehydrogenase [Pseudoluteimonas lycopersici]|uniref:Putative peptide maturation dehydrogenase n=1 Tax=Pseudoluteimonas lycopersici TaxID=1324796 RepID=A0A516V8E5_9GAMM|nr:putative peptide maturation dehydrogenase [Lysobacter lycopersici]QDQ74809.1 putative peptide maturation dehydrogenase [Lysobacter lycopersici]